MKIYSPLEEGQLIIESISQEVIWMKEFVLSVRCRYGQKRIGLVGKADLVEFHDSHPYPVDYKHGPKRVKEHDDLQLCAIAMCLEEMTGKSVPKGAIYHVSSRRRREVTFNNDMREKVEKYTVQIREMIEKGIVPPAEYNEKCRNCSLIDACLPEVVEPKAKRMRFLLQSLFEPMEE